MHQEIPGLSKCNLCGNNDFKLLFHGNIGDDVGSRFSQYAYYDDIYRCNNCRLVAQRQLYDGEAIKQFLQEEKYLDEAIGNLNLVEKHFQFNVASLEASIPWAVLTLSLTLARKTPVLAPTSSNS